MEELLTSRNVQPASPPAAGQASRFLAWLAEDGNPALTRLICAWLQEPRSAAESAPACAWDVAVVRAEMLAAWPPGEASAAAPSCEPGPGKARPAASDAGRQPAALACPRGARRGR